MAVRSGYKQLTVNELMANLDKRIGRLYLLWFTGILIGIVGLTPSSLSIAGLSLNVAQPDAFQGLIYIATLFYAINMYTTFISSKMLSRRPFIRIFIHMNLTKGRRTLRGYNRDARLLLRAKVLMWVLWGSRVLAASILLPAAVIILFSHSSLWSALKVIF